MQQITLAQLYLSFLVFGLMGWTYESFVWAPGELRMFVNRGFLIGPICPIYALVCIMDWWGLTPLESPFAIFLVSAVICCVFEYTISYTFEKLFGKRWWDYSNYAFNLHGRVSLYSSVLFGLAGVLSVKVVCGGTIALMQRLPVAVANRLALVFAVIQSLDLLWTVLALMDVIPPLTRAYEAVNLVLNRPFDNLNKRWARLQAQGVGKKARAFINLLAAANQRLIMLENRMLKRKPNED